METNWGLNCLLGQSIYIFSKMFRPTLGPYLGFLFKGYGDPSPSSKATEAWGWPFTSIQCKRLRISGDVTPSPAPLPLPWWQTKGQLFELCYAYSFVKMQQHTLLFDWNTAHVSQKKTGKTKKKLWNCGFLYLWLKIIKFPSSLYQVLHILHAKETE
jgi:hypothetical protein